MTEITKLLKIVCTCSYCTDIVKFLFGNKPRAGLEMFYRHDETFQNSAATGLLPNKMLTTAIVPSIITDIINFYCTNTLYFKGRVTLILPNNYLTEYRITMEF